MDWSPLADSMIQVFRWKVMAGMGFGLFAGILFGSIPGLNATLGIVLILPFIWGMDPYIAFAILLSMVSAVHTSNTFPAFFFNVPGSPSAAATIIDGYPMAKNGAAAEGLTAAFLCSAVGGIIGALTLFALFPVLRPLVLEFASPEKFMLVMLGIVFISVLSGERPLRGLAIGMLGLLLGTIGQDPQSGHIRYGFGQDYLIEGLSLVPLVMGMFALPEVMSLAVRGRIAEKTAVDMGAGFMPGLRATIKNWGTMIRSSLVGVIGGAIPGIGGTASAFYAYGLTVQMAKPEDRDKFGKGEIKGVIAPESANNASAGGELIPLIAFGVPGGSTTALLLGALILLGLNPGPEMLGKDIAVSYSMVTILVLSNLCATTICIALTPWATLIAWVRGNLIIPAVLSLALFGAYAAFGHPGTLIAVLCSGILGYVMMRLGWTRVPLLLGFILGPLAEESLFISTAAYGPSFLLRPMPLVLGVLILAVLAYGLFRMKAGK